MLGQGSGMLQNTGCSFLFLALCSFTNTTSVANLLFFFMALSLPSLSLNRKMEKCVFIHSFSKELSQQASCMIRPFEAQRTYLLSAQGSTSILSESLKVVKINENIVYICANYFFKE